MPITELAAAVALLRKPIDDLYSTATGQLKSLIGKWNTAGRIDEISQKVREVEIVSSMFRSEPTPLSDFYYPSRIEIPTKGKQVTKHVDRLDEISIDGNILIVGTLGQGKSMFMRYLCVQELKSGKKIPLFLELRGIDESTRLKDLMIDGLRQLGMFEINDDAFDFILQKGSFTIFLDGFDEVKREQMPRLRKELFALMRRYTMTRFVISSRPGVMTSLIIQAPKIQRVLLGKLQREDFRPFLKRLGRDDKNIDSLLKAIDTSPTDIQNVLTTPLMLTLLNEAFGTSANIPDTLHYFYESMFTVLVLRHDQLKQTFSRERAAPLNNLQLQEAFECFSFLSKDIGVSLTDDQFAQCAKDVKILTGLDVSPDDLKTDFTEAVCLMMVDGLKTAFIHKSIQEFFAAFYVSHLKDDEVVKQIYEDFTGNKIVSWVQELTFLEKLDNLRYTKYFHIPSCKRFLNETGFNPKSRVLVSKANFKKFIQSLDSVIAEGESIGGKYLLLNMDSKSFNFGIMRVISGMGFPNVANMNRRDINTVKNLPTLKSNSFWDYIAENGIENSLTSFRNECKKIYDEIQLIQQDLLTTQQNSREILFRKRAAN